MIGNSQKWLLAGMASLLSLTSGSFLYQAYLSHNQPKVLGVSRIPKDKVIVEDKVASSSATTSALFDFKHYYYYKPHESFLRPLPWDPSQEIHYTINNDSLNDTQDYSPEKPENTLRIIAIGDSFTYGDFVNTGEAWPDQLEKTLPQLLPACQVEVINLGMPGFDIPYLVKRYQDFGTKYQADIVLWFENGSGFERMTEASSTLWENCHYTVDDSKPLDDQDIYKCWEEVNQKIDETTPLSEKIDHYNRYLSYFFLELITDEEVLFFTGRPQFTPNQNQVLTAWQNHNPQMRFYQTSSEFPLTPEFRLPDNHPNQKGHTLIAELATSILQEHSEKIKRCLR